MAVSWHGEGATVPALACASAELRADSTCYRRRSSSRSSLACSARRPLSNNISRQTATRRIHGSTSKMQPRKNNGKRSIESGRGLWCLSLIESEFEWRRSKPSPKLTPCDSIASVMGRPYQIQEAKPLLLPSHPMSLPFDLGQSALFRSRALAHSAWSNRHHRPSGAANDCRSDHGYLPRQDLRSAVSKQRHAFAHGHEGKWACGGADERGS